MAKPTGPLLSLGASGTLAKTLVYSKWKGRPYVRRWVTPANPQTAGQDLTRNVFSYMSDLWKGAPTDVRSPWVRFAQGQVLTGRNAFIGKNITALRTEVLLTNFIGSPGAKGGLAADSIVLTPGVDELAVAFTVPAVPTGWTLFGSIAMAIFDQDPQSPVNTIIVADTNEVSPFGITLAGLTQVGDYVVSAWLQWTKPDGSTAYGPSINATDAPT